MTNTLHRYGKADSFNDDYIIFAIPSKGKNDEDCIPKLKEFLKICARHNPVNMGNGQRGKLTPDKDLGPSSHWNRSEKPDYEAVIDGVVKPGTVSAVFGDASDATNCLQEIIEADFGISVNISTSVENAKGTGPDHADRFIDQDEKVAIKEQELQSEEAGCPQFFESHAHRMKTCHRHQDHGGSHGQ